MIEEIFADLQAYFVPGAVQKPTSYYFSLGDVKKSVQISVADCIVTDGKTLEDADCVCKTSPEFFVKIWRDGYRPGLKDFLSGTIKSNNPNLLQDFLRCFGKEA